MIRVSSMDAGLLHAETPEMPMHTMGVLLLEKPAHSVYDGLHRALQKRLHLIEPFRRRLVAGPMQIGDPHWLEDPDFDLDNHLYRAALPAPGGMRELEVYAGDLAGRLLDRARPLWEMHVLEGLRGGKVALIVKVHHAAMDGGRLVALMGALLDTSPRGRRVPPPDHEWIPEQEPSLAWMALDASRTVAAKPINALRTIAEIGGVLLRNRSAGAPGPEPQEHRAKPFEAPATPFNGRLSAQRTVAMADVSFDDMTTIKNAFGTTVNDVVLAASCAGLRGWLLAHDGLPEQPLVASVPVSVRSEGAGDAEAGNRVSMILAELPVQDDDSLRRLRAINAATSRAKQHHGSSKGDVFRQTADLLINLSTPWMLQHIMALYSGSDLPDRLPLPWNLVISNLPGPRKPLYCAGARVQRVYPFGPLQLGSGLNITVMSAGDRLCVGALACKRRMPDVALVTQAFVAEIAQLKKLARKAQSRGLRGS
jgi:diacylglycerol O-acyltransferase / wax synthase